VNQVTRADARRVGTGLATLDDLGRALAAEKFKGFMQVINEAVEKV
jgi:hypothetical protein